MKINVIIIYILFSLSCSANKLNKNESIINVIDINTIIDQLKTKSIINENEKVVIRENSKVEKSQLTDFFNYNYKHLFKKNVKTFYNNGEKEKWILIHNLKFKEKDYGIGPKSKKLLLFRLI